MRSIFVRGRVSAQTLFQDAREVRTKRRKTFTSIFFPVGPEPLKIVTEYIEMLKSELGFSNDDPLFPSTDVGRGEDRGFIAQGLSRRPWTGAGPIRRIFRGAFGAAGLLVPIRTAFGIHSFGSASVFAARRRSGRLGVKA